MQVQRAKLRNFRNFAQLQLEFGPRFTVLHGHNGAGKTNILEALYLVSTLRSFRSAELGPLLRHEEREGSVEVEGRDPEVDLPSRLCVTLERTASSTRRTAVADGKTVRSGAAFYGRVRAVLFTPEDLAILRGGPSGRRQFLDRVLFARDRTHITDIQNYEKFLRSRNHVLKREDLTTAQRIDLLETYEAGLAEVGARVWNRREGLLKAIGDLFARAFERIHGQFGALPESPMAKNAPATLHYCTKLASMAPQDRAPALRQALRSGRAEDFRRRNTGIGPHRDDLKIELDGQIAGQFASQGQSRALVLAFKLAELKLAAVEGPRLPLLLLDDVSSELDPRRSKMLFEALTDHAGQCVLTTTDAGYVALPECVEARWWKVEQGQIHPSSGPSGTPVR